MTTSASPISATPAVSTTPPVPQPKGQRHRIITPTTPYIDIGKPVVNLRDNHKKSHAKLTQGQRNMTQEMLDEDVHRTMPIIAHDKLES